MFNSMNSSQMMPYMQMMQQGNPFASPQSGLPPQGNMAPQIPVRGQQQQGAPMQPPALPAQGQQGGFFGNMMSSPSQMQSGFNLMNHGADGISSMFGSGGSSASSAPVQGVFNLGNSSPVGASGYQPGMQALNNSSFFGPGGPASSAGGSAGSVGSGMGDALPAIGEYQMARSGLNAIHPGLGDAGSFSLSRLFGLNL